MVKELHHVTNLRFSKNDTFVLNLEIKCQESKSVCLGISGVQIRAHLHNDSV